MTILINVLLAIFVVVAVLMVFVILMQRPKSEGLGAAFGGGVTENLFGAQTTNVLTRITTWLAGVFFVITLVLAVLYSHRNSGTRGLREELLRTEAPVAAGSPAAAATAAPAPAVAVPGEANPPGSIPPDAATEGSPASPADLAVGAVRPVPPANAALAVPEENPPASPAPSP